jgi:hypothetical protein
MNSTLDFSEHELLNIFSEKDQPNLFCDENLIQQIKK